MRPWSGGGLILVVASGCPHAYGIEGSIDRAVLKDLIENASRAGCPKEELQDLCGDEFVDCMANCQMRMRRNARP
ncbi:hypothetical protein D187_003364 [Cystobacter fuscus DSM 2262]|uniref:Lipoprotein n=1 Tax=Cystobacter fuscus (strain ATCC 25194 / DSM 2262 / NBRC 100088 / M29) TaxID=1242864 RepID=S9P9N9_CYSF2|nr:hypothetical protein D187_003364 [Cystobacter fuscus DSM 2262]